MSELLNLLKSGRILLMDGAMGTELQQAGLGLGENPTHWNVLHPDAVECVHHAYLHAKARVFLTNTFMLFADPVAAFPSVQDCFRKAISLLPSGGLKVAAFGPAWGDPMCEFERIDRLHWIEPMLDAVDAIMLETCSSSSVEPLLCLLRECRPQLPVLVSFSFLRSEGALVTTEGHSPEWHASRVATLGISALGVNCCRDLTLDETVEIVRRYRATTSLPLFVRPNAGSPVRTPDGRFVYPVTPEDFAAHVPAFLSAGAVMLGGCCGTTPTHIKAIHDALAKRDD